MANLSDTQLVILNAATQRADGNVLPLPGSLRGGAATKVVDALLKRGLIQEFVVDSPRKADAAMNAIWRNQEDGRGVLLFITAAGADAIGVTPDAADDQPADAPVPYHFNEGTNSAGEPALGSAAEAGEEAPSGDAATTDAPEAPEAPTGADVGGQGDPEVSGETPDAPQAEIDRLKLDVAAKAKAAAEAEEAAKVAWIAWTTAKEAAKAAAKALKDAEKAATKGRARISRVRSGTRIIGADGSISMAPKEPSKQEQLIAMLKRPEGATIAQIVEAFGWQRHTVHGAFAGALKKKLGLNVVSEKPAEGDRVYRIVAAA